MGKLTGIFYAILLSACICESVTGMIFGKGKETIFSYSADVRTGTVDPALFASQFGLTSTLSIISSKDGSSAIFQFKNISLQVYNGPLSTDEEPEANFLSTSHRSLEVPFEVSYNNGLVKSIFTEENKETTLSVNMKKSIASILQLDMSKLHFDKSNSFPSEEKTLYGTCPVDYSVVIQGDGNASIRKMPSLSGCKGAQKRQYWTNLVETLCSSEAKKIFDIGNSRVFEVHSSGGELSIKKVVAQGTVSFIPYPEDGYSQYIQIKQTLQQESQKRSAKYFSKPGKKQNEPTFNGDIKENEYLNFPKEASEQIKPKLKSLVQTQLNNLVDLSEKIRIGDPGDKGGFLEQKQKDQTHSILFQLMSTMRYLDYESLKTIYHLLDVGTSSRDETLRTMFLELLSQTGTKASIHISKYLVVNKVVKKDSAIQILKTVPFYIRNPHEELLHIYEGVLGINYDDQVKQAAILSFATMVNRVCKNNNCPPELLDKYIIKYLEHFQDSSEYQWKLVYLEGLSNIKIGNVVKYLEPIIKGDQPYSHHLRFLAVWASHQTAIHDPERVFEVYWPILENKSEHLELRVGAFTMLLLSKPSPERLHSLVTLMEEEPEGSHLYYFFYSSIESLSGTTHPCYQELKKPAQHLLYHIRRPEKLPLWTGNHMFDYVERYHKYGSFMQAFMVADQKTSWPNVMYFLQNEHFLGYNHQGMSFYIKLQGVKNVLNDYYSYSRDGDKFTKLQKILSKYGIDEVVEEDEPAHIELIIQYQDQAVMTYYYNETNIMKFLELLWNSRFTDEDFHVNYQRLLFPMLNELTAPTDLGLPMSFKNQIPLLLSFRGNFPFIKSEEPQSEVFQIDLKYWKQTESFLSVYNPVSNLWHGISRVHSALVHIPLKFQVIPDIKEDGVKFILNRHELTPGAGIHAGSVVFATPTLSFEEGSQNTLSLSCPSCTSYTPVKGDNYREKLEYENEELGKLKMNYINRYFDCDVYEMPFILGDATNQMEVNVNDRFLDGLSLLEVFQYHDAMMRLPLSGRCGVIVKISPEIDPNLNNLSTNLYFKAENFRDEEMIATAQVHKEKYVFKGFISQERLDGVTEKLYEYMLSYQKSLTFLHHYLKFKFSSIEPSQNQVLKMCLDAGLHYPNPPVDPLKQREPQNEAVDGLFHLTFGKASQNKCPKTGAIFKVDFRATPVPDKNQECYRTCIEDAESPEWAESSTLMPYTPACIEAAMDSTRLRRFELRTEVSNFISVIADKSLYALYMEHGSDPWGDYIIDANNSINEYPVIKDDKGYVFEIAPNGLLLVDTVEDEETERMVLNLGLNSKLSSRFHEDQLATESESIYESCIIAPKVIFTLDGTQISDEIGSCYSLALGHCKSTNPLFAVMVRRLEETNKLALKVYSFANYLEVIPSSNNTAEMNLNGELVDFDSDNGYEFRNGSSMFRVWQRTSRKEKNNPYYIHISSFPSYIKLEYGLDRVRVELSAMYSGDICGLCGDFVRPQNHHNWEICEEQE